MKKILLILAVFVAFNANAQFNNSSVFNSPTNETIKDNYREAYTGPVERISTPNKKTRAINGWMSYQDANFVSGLQSAGLWPVTADSNILSTAGTPPFHWYVHGLGTSFDPTSQKFYDGALGYVTPGGGEIGPNNTFTIDSVQVVGAYRRRVNQTDQLRIEFSTTASSSLILGYPADAYWFNNYGLQDSTFSFASPQYDWANNKMLAPDVTITKTLDLAARNDTTANGLNIYNIKLPTPLTVAPGEKVTAFLTFVPAVPDVFGTPLDNSNYWSHYCVESNGPDTHESPYNNEFVGGLIANTDARYNLTPNPIQGNEYLTSTYAFGATAGFDEPFFSFYVNCPTCTAVGVDDITALEGVSVYPNPSNGVVNINTNDNLLNKDVSINIVDLSGKTVHSEMFKNTSSSKRLELSNVAAGAYIYTISSDNKVAHGKLIIE